MLTNRKVVVKFRLLFEGEIRPRRGASLQEIHAIRRRLHPQIKRLWHHPPFSDAAEEWLKELAPEGKETSYARITAVGERKYAPLIAADMAAELDITFLRQQPPGQLIGEGGDIDNRLKTLFDAFRMPTKSEVRDLGGETQGDEEPLHCLLKDDSLIHRVNVETDRLLKDASPHELVALIQVTVVVTRVTFGTIGFGGR